MGRGGIWLWCILYKSFALHCIASESRLTNVSRSRTGYFMTMITISPGQRERRVESEEGPGVNSAHVGCRGGEGAVSDLSSCQPREVYVQLLLSAVQAGMT